MVGLFQVVQLVSDKEDSLVFEEASDAVVEEMLAHLGIHGREGVVEQVGVFNIWLKPYRLSKYRHFLIISISKR